MLCCSDYSEKVVDSFTQQIQPEYYGGNISVSIEVISFEHFSANTHPLYLSVPSSHTPNYVFPFFVSDEIKQDTFFTAEHIKCII